MSSSKPLFVVAVALSMSVNAIPLAKRADATQDEQLLPPDEDESGPDGHLNHSWIVAVAVSLVVILLGVVGVIFFLKWRQRRRRRNNARRSYPRAPAENLLAVPEQPYDRIWKGPYASRSSYNRSPSPPSQAHLSEKDRWASPKR